MTLQQVQVLLQSVSSFAIAGSLIFAAIQLRNWRRATYVSNFSKMVELQNQLRRIRVDHPELASVHKHDVQDLTSPRAVQDYFLNLMQLALFEIAWFSYRQGQLPDDYYQSWENKMKSIFTEESFRKMIHKPGMKILHEEFYRYVVQMMHDAGVPLSASVEPATAQSAAQSVTQPAAQSAAGQPAQPGLAAGPASPVAPVVPVPAVTQVMPAAPIDVASTTAAGHPVARADSSASPAA